MNNAHILQCFGLFDTHHGPKSHKRVQNVQAKQDVQHLASKLKHDAGNECMLLSRWVISAHSCDCGCHTLPPWCLHLCHLPLIHTVELWSYQQCHILVEHPPRKPGLVDPGDTGPWVHAVLFNQQRNLLARAGPLAAVDLGGSLTRQSSAHNQVS